MTYEKTSELRMVSLDRLHPHPDNPRRELGDLTELAESIKANGILQNLTIVPMDGDEEEYRVIIGHRRSAAARLAGLREVPCMISNMTPVEQLQTMLLENMQRSDLTVYEQAKGFQMMLDLGSSVEEISEKSGFSQSTVRRRIKMMELDQEMLKKVSERQPSLMDFDRLAQIESLDERNKCLEMIATNSFNNIVETTMRRQSIRKRLPIVKNLLKEAEATALKQSETWSGKYQQVGPYIMIGEWDGEATLIPEEAEGEKLFYFMDEGYGSLRFYREVKKAKPEKKSPEEIAQRKRLAAAWEKVDELQAVCYRMRNNFVERQVYTSLNASKLLKGAVDSIVIGMVGYTSADVGICRKILGEGLSYDSQRVSKAMEALKQVSPKDLPKLIYANYGDGKELSYISTYRGEMPHHKPDARLDALYEWLECLGYRMSSGEKALQDGTHEIFRGGEK